MFLNRLLFSRLKCGAPGVVLVTLQGMVRARLEKQPNFGTLW
jgi:hypothetical protein